MTEYQTPQEESVANPTSFADVREQFGRAKEASGEKWGQRGVKAKEGLFGAIKGARERAMSAAKKVQGALATVDALRDKQLRDTTVDFIDANYIAPRLAEADRLVKEMQATAQREIESAKAAARAGIDATGRGLKWTADRGVTAAKWGAIGTGVVVAAPFIGVGIAGYGVYKAGEYGARQGVRGARWTGEQARAGGQWTAEQARAGAQWTGEQIDRGVTAGREAYRSASEAVRSGVNRALDSLNRQQLALRAEARALGNRVDAAWNDALAYGSESFATGRKGVADTLDTAATRFHGFLRGDGETAKKNADGRRERATKSREARTQLLTKANELRTNGRT